MAMVSGLIVGFIMASNNPYVEDMVLEIAGQIVGVIVSWIYFAAFESSAKQGTPGKIALGIIITDLNDNRISFGKASGRYFGKFISSLIIGIGFLMVAFTHKKQGLHDMMAGCLVKNKNGSLPTTNKSFAKTSKASSISYTKGDLYNT
tara:strand:- start:5198 stop:5641 length:444 start_codon:yes stop_codon:yes gene_type:complete